VKKPSPAKPQRCAIYTRKSTEHNLDLAFNSLDAQREACEAYIKSQAHEGWKLIPTHFDDGGLSGASLDRPALQSLLDQVRAKRIDIVVVYKVDRLTRSLADFAKLVELFDEHEVSFVSVTQSFNTTSSMGRLTLNVLLSFAQFEREVIGERVRDKIAASKRKGIWVGGSVPLGYRAVNKKLEVVPKEAEVVRKIFSLYVEVGSVGDLARALDQEGIRPQPRQLANGQVKATERYTVGPLAHMLKNRMYVGEVAYRGEVHKGEHPAIVDRDVFDRVQSMLAERSVARKLKRGNSPHLLTGLIFDDRGNPMSPTHANKKGVRYRYYTSHALLQRRKEDGGSVPRVSAPEVEALVCAAVRRENPSGTDKLSDKDLVAQHVSKVIVRRDRIAVEIGSDSDREEPGFASKLVIPFSPTVTAQKGITQEPANNGHIDAVAREKLLSVITRATKWVDGVRSGEVASFDEIAAEEGVGDRHVRWLVPLAFLSPTILTAIIDGSAPAGLNVATLAKALPHSWSAQESNSGLVEGSRR
jgi:DNA invertase Pin-like site-specific DNA recombinase